MLRIDIHAVHPNVTLRCSGRIVLGLEAETLRCMATSRKENCLTLDLQWYPRTRCRGTRSVGRVAMLGKPPNKTLRIAEPSTCVRRLIALTNLQSVLQIGGCKNQSMFGRATISG